MATKHDLGGWIVDALGAFGGSASLVEICRQIWEQHETELRGSGDLFFTWQYDTRWAAHRLRVQRRLKPASESPRLWGPLDPEGGAEGVGSGRGGGGGGLFFGAGFGGCPGGSGWGENSLVRSRRWLVEEVVESQTAGQSPLVRLACADDDAQGQSLDVFWDYELDRRILEEEGWRDLAAKGFDPPRQFAAFLHTLRWNCVTATDPNLFQAPFRAGIKIDAYQMEPLAQGAPSAARQPLHRRRHGPRQDDRGGPDRARAAAAQEGEDHRRRDAALGSRAMEGRAGGALRPRVRDPRPRLPDADAARARLRREPVAHAQPLPGLAQPPDRPDLRGPDARVARADAAREPPDPRRGAPRRAVERRPLRHRDQVHARRARPQRSLRAPPVPLGHAAQRPLEQLLDAPRAARSLPLHARRQGARQEGARGRDGAPPQGGHPRGPGRVSPVASSSASRSTACPTTRPELVLSRLLDEYRTAREERFASTTRRAQAAAGLLVVGLQQRLLSSIEAFARSLKVHRATVERQWEKANAQQTLPRQSDDR